MHLVGENGVGGRIVCQDNAFCWLRCPLLPWGVVVVVVVGRVLGLPATHLVDELLILVDPVRFAAGCSSSLSASSR